MSFVFNDINYPMAWFLENTDCRNDNWVDNCWGDIVLSKLIYLRKEFLLQDKK